MIKKILCLTIFLVVVMASVSLLGRHKTPQTWPEVLRAEYGAPEYESIDKNKPLNDQTAIVEMAGRTFEIPKVFIQSNLGGKREQKDGINLVYVMPDFTSQADFKDKAEYNEAFNNRRMSHMLVQPAKTSTPVPQVIENRTSNGQLSKYEGSDYGLEKYIDYDDPRHLNIHYDDTYIEKDGSGNAISFISCSAARKQARSPGCSHIFFDKGLKYDIYFNKEKYLPTWQEHRRKAIEFIDSFEIEAPLESREKTGE